MDGNKKKAELLGEAFGTASNKLRKIILFNLLIELKKNVCFQCGKQIKEVEQLSIEHKTPWMSAKNPKQSFYDLNNISFSHLSCNRKAANRKTGIRENTPHGMQRYRNGCRCEICISISKEYYKSRNATEERKKYNREYQKSRYNIDNNFKKYHIEKSKKYYGKTHLSSKG